MMAYDDDFDEEEMYSNSKKQRYTVDVMPA